ncbi:uncharacterized protein NECHADRAFT_77671 [Fusarium vanettenii 77-13-4]|uniref:Uncharacterized protein n=1 Tax=Fusarium vanettenii (strain ATCC MYA-4622 / CBS 123669 / FGSC 9596 / NRRL 45880 / 77-13-4) TaxID=660122 RepID=C7YLV9_FUSV7|nr:uncharacterized protein NECHADRAFT_77671 [Fusarium vanettenii 77-13-4]EEU47340.1 predicted protein [Fusarium vanettenii 77-13-4]
MRPKGDRHEGEPEEEQFPAVQARKPENLVTEPFMQQVDNQLKRTLARLEGTKKGTLSKLGRQVEGIVRDATPESRDEVRKALEVMQHVTKQYIEAVFEEAVDASRSDSQSFQDILIELDSEMNNRHETEMAALEKTLGEAQQTDAVFGEPTTKPQAGCRGRGAPTMPSRTSTAGSSDKAFEDMFGGANQPRTSAWQSSHRPPKPTARGSFKSSQGQNKNKNKKFSFQWDRGGRRQGSVDSVGIGSESESKTEVPLEADDLKSTDYEDLDPMMRSLLEAGEDLHKEFKKDASKAGTEEWQADMEYAELQEQLNQALLEYNKQRGMVVQKDQLIDGLREEVTELKNSNLDLTASLESMGRAPSAGGAGTPIPSQFGRFQSVTSFPFNSAGGSPGTSNVAWLSMWLPKAVRLQMETTKAAIKRCDAEEKSCTEKMLQLGGGRQTSKERDCLTARRSSSEKHRQDFTLIKGFLEELSGHSKKSENNLADELSGIGSAESIETVKKMPTPGQTPTGNESSKNSSSGSVFFESQGRDASTSPKESSNEAHGPSKSPKRQGSTPKVPSPLAESHTPQASETAPEAGNAPLPASNTAAREVPLEGNNEQVREPADPENATQRAVETIDSGVLGMWSFFAHAGLVAMTHAGAFVRVSKFILHIFTYIMNQISRVVRLMWPFSRAAEEESPAPTLPKLPSPECFIVVMYYCSAFLTFQVYMATQRERQIWFEANGLTRKYMLERSRGESLWLIYGVDGNLIVGRKDVEDSFKLVYLLGVKSVQHLYRLAQGTPP